MARYTRELDPDRVYLSVPTRPPAVSGVLPAGEETLIEAHQVFLGEGLPVELMVGMDSTDFAATGDVAEDILAITSVHPMRRASLEDLVRKAGADWGMVEGLLRRRKLRRLEFAGEDFYVRNLETPADRSA
jgi:wyosine [tRNA(Phe)-imidazoG37] synthetase (radical SAM superfamily)